MRASHRILSIVLTLIVAPFLPAQGSAGTTQRDGAPTLLVFITVDQFRPDYLDRFHGQLVGGLARLASKGAVLDSAFQDHAITETAPGHSVTMSGRYPSHTGIAKNSTGVEDARAPLLDAPGPGASPARFRGTTLTDWLVARDARTKVLSVSRKDRGAILPIGRSKQQVYWYAANGHFTTSTYYADSLPPWVRQFNERRLPQQAAGRSWTLLLPESSYPEPDAVPQEDNGQETTFPHTIPADTASAARVFPNFPEMDQVTLEMALAGVRALGLGQGPQMDLLAVSLSTTDAVGHRFGPDSRELHDQILRLDRSLGAFFDTLFTLRDSSKIIMVMTADHGVTSYPEISAQRGSKGGQRVDVVTALQRQVATLTARGAGANPVSYEEGLLAVDRDGLAKAHLPVDSVLNAIAADLRTIPGVLRVDRVSALAKADTVRDAVARRWLHALPSDLPVDMVITLQEHAYPAGVTVAMHGSPFDDDAHVPIIFYGAPFRPGHYPIRARVVDIAPTLARVTNVKPSEKLDGRVLQDVLRSGQ